MINEYWMFPHYRSLNDNKFSGEIPSSIGKLRKLYWLDIANNQLSGDLPVSSGDTPGLDLLVNTKHLYVYLALLYEDGDYCVHFGFR